MKFELYELTSELIDICSSPVPTRTSDLWTEHLAIKEVISKIRQGQRGQELRFPSERDVCLSKFLSWCRDESLLFDGLEIKPSKNGFGLFAKRHFQFGDVAFKIPRESMLVLHDSIRDSKSFKLVHENDPIISRMDNVALAVCLLCEKLNGRSRWKAYLDFLPRVLPTPLYWNDASFEWLKGSSAYTDALKMYRSVCRQYGYFYQLLVNKTSVLAKLNLKPETFTFDAYRWAVSVVSTRLNQVPLEPSEIEADVNGSTKSICLIPLWDLANHSNLSQMCTDYDDAKRECVCFVPTDLKPGDEMMINYGARSNAEMLVYNGFCLSENPRKVVLVRLGFSKSDKLHDQRAAIAWRFGLGASQDFFVTSTQPYFTAEILFFVRLIQATEEQLNVVEAQIAKELSESVERRPNLPLISTDSERKAWIYLKNRLELMNRTFPKSIEDALLHIDSEADNAKDDIYEVDCSKFAALLVAEEQDILINATDYAQKMSDYFEEP